MQRASNVALDAPGRIATTSRSCAANRDVNPLQVEGRAHGRSGIELHCFTNPGGFHVDVEVAFAKPGRINVIMAALSVPYPGKQLFLAVAALGLAVAVVRFRRSHVAEPDMTSRGDTPP